MAEEEKEPPCESQESQAGEKTSPIHGKDRTVAELEEENEHLKKYLKEKDRVIEAKEKKIQQLNQQLQGSHRQLQGKDQQLQEKEDAIIALKEEIGQLKDDLEATDHVPEQLLKPASEHQAICDDDPSSDQSSSTEDIQANWLKGGKAPSDMRRGASTVDGSIAYFAPYNNNSIHAYDSVTEEWSKLPECPQRHVGLAVLNGLLTAIGGEQAFKATNTLLSLTGADGERKWSEHFPPMPTKRYCTAVASNSKSLIVAGGQASPKPIDRLNTVEIMDIATLQWSIARSLPQQTTQASATICQDKLFLLGGVEENGKTKTVLACSLETLIKCGQARRQSLGSKLRSLSRSESRGNDRTPVWVKMDNLPANLSTCATLAGHLLAIGGYSDMSNGPTSVVRIFNPRSKMWDILGDMPTARYMCLVATFPHKLMVVGGAIGVISDCDAVEIASFL